MKVCIVSSCGGHLTEVRRLLPAYSEYKHFYVLDDTAILPKDMTGRTYFLTRFKRSPTRVLLNIWEAFRILRDERPQVVLSAGAGGVVPVALVARLCFGIRVVYVETLARPVTPSATGRIMYYFAHRFFYQWEALGKFFPKGKFGGRLI